MFGRPTLGQLLAAQRGPLFPGPFNQILNDLRTQVKIENDQRDRLQAIGRLTDPHHVGKLLKRELFYDMKRHIQERG